MAAWPSPRPRAQRADQILQVRILHEGLRPSPTYQFLLADDLAGAFRPAAEPTGLSPSSRRLCSARSRNGLKEIACPPVGLLTESTPFYPILRGQRAGRRWLVGLARPGYAPSPAPENPAIFGGPAHKRRATASWQFAAPMSFYSAFQNFTRRGRPAWAYTQTEIFCSSTCHLRRAR